MSFDNGTSGFEVTGPACTKPKFGLLSVAEVENRTDAHWQMGVFWEQEPCVDGIIAVTPCPPNPQSKVEHALGLTYPQASPFTLVAGFKCSVPGRGMELSKAWEHASTRLDRGEQRALERIFWTGKDVSGNLIKDSLNENTDVVDLTPAGGALAMADGVAALESALGDCYPCNPIFHANRGVATYLAERSLINPISSETMRMFGTTTLVASGGGYGISGPGGVVPAPGEAWLYGTGGVKIIRGPEFFTPGRDEEAASIDRLINDQIVYAERSYAFELDCCVFAVRVTTKSCCAC